MAPRRNFIHSTKAKYFYKDVVRESVDGHCGDGEVGAIASMNRVRQGASVVYEDQ